MYFFFVVTFMDSVHSRSHRTNVFLPTVVGLSGLAVGGAGGYFLGKNYTAAHKERYIDMEASEVEKKVDANLNEILIFASELYLQIESDKDFYSDPLDLNKQWFKLLSVKLAKMLEQNKINGHVNPNLSSEILENFNKHLG